MKKAAHQPAASGGWPGKKDRIAVRCVMTEPYRYEYDLRKRDFRPARGYALMVTTSALGDR